MQLTSLEISAHPSAHADFCVGDSTNGQTPRSSSLVSCRSSQESLSTSDVSTPLCFKSSVQPRVWGGQALSKILKHQLPNDEPYGEAWDLSSLPEHVSRVADGPHIGRTLTELWNKHRNEFVGKRTTTEESFPLLIKWLECRDLLSVQVHPDDNMAREFLNEPRGKSEVWIVLQADPTARILAGLKTGVTREEFVKHLNSGTLSECLHSFTPQAGDCIALPAGTIHAAGGGLLIAEVQQSSNATFRLFDWNRLGLDGRPRPLQIEMGMQAIDWSQGPVHPVQPTPIANDDDGARGETLAEMPAFRLERYTVSKPWSAPHAGELTLWMVLDGDVKLMHSQTNVEREISMGRTVLVPAAAGKTIWTPTKSDRPATLLCVRLP